ncbi:MAG: hypothetical protein K1X95_03535 [Acidimicrobiia bacterium]|nr:hypothetical protein [Acidimicrobiia bacterium]
MASEIRTKDIAKASFTCSLASLANGSARQSTMVDNSSNDRPAALVYLKIQLGGDPTSDGQINVYLLRGNDASSSDYRTDGAGASDAAITVGSAWCIGSIFVATAKTTNDYVYGDFDTGVVPGPLGPEWGIAIENKSGVSLGSTEGNHYKGYVYYVPESQ